MSPRPALLPVNHPLSYHEYSLSESAAEPGAQDGTKKSNSKPSSELAQPRTLEDMVRYLYEHQQITDLLNEYAYVLDVCMVDHRAIEKWTDLFTEDCDVTFPFGNHKGKDGLAKWCVPAAPTIFRMLHASSNFTITFDPDSENVAHARTVLHAVCGIDEHDLGKTFQEGGYYYWSFRRNGGEWKISYLFLDVNWTSGDSLGLNDPGATERQP
ncbi:hypothetical protein A1O7_06942 [Cladophialophora yegresii CBS 114405]|uniref:SnoaL-like domain-containing protein n=1 Tax=Cladophialophora yegresii CBS 114405 TaxID=1182544 RepID=W9VM53_9EURO|nr:uncharacterized protein A1O7_06942 [Cladophialophora yegresii CBS 114405]EXJ56598.1 hypothetical protein A1O7_06942 [Cladophialophora yegresii CBS 114405]